MKYGMPTFPEQTEILQYNTIRVYGYGENHYMLQTNA